MPILGPDGKPVLLKQPNYQRTEDALSSGPSRQQIRAYLRSVAMYNINTRYGLEPRSKRRSMAFTLAKNEQFILAVKEATTRVVEV